MEDKEEESHIQEIVSTQPNGRSRYYIVGGLLLVIIGLILYGFFPRLFQKEKLDKRALQEAPLPVVRVMTAKPDKKNITLVLPTYLQGINITPVWAMTNGYLKMWYVDIGDRVKAGQLMADVDIPEVDQSLERSRADLVSLKAKLEIARITAERWQGLYDRNREAISKQEVDQNKATYQSVLADVLAAEANVKRLEAMQAYGKIYAPFDGTVTSRNIDIGSLITGGSNNNPQQLFEVAKDDVVRAFIDVPQPYYRMIKDGLEAQLIVDQYPDKPFMGKVVRNSGALNPIARTLRTQVNIDNPKRDLLVGLYGNVKLVLEPDNDVFILPTRAIIIRNGPTYVGIVDEHHKVRLQEVDIGLNFGKSLEIISGIKEGELIIVDPSDKIKDGVEVVIESERA